MTPRIVNDADPARPKTFISARSGRTFTIPDGPANRNLYWLFDEQGRCTGRVIADSLEKAQLIAAQP